MKTLDQTELNLVRALQSGSPADFSILYDAYTPALYGVLLQLVKNPDWAEDLLQDVFVKVWSNRQHYDCQQGRLFTWLLTITRHIALDELRHRKVHQKVAEYLRQQADSLTYSPVVAGTVHHSLLSQLGPKYRAIIELIYYQDFTALETAEHLQLPLGTVKTRLRKALQDLKAYFGPDIHYYLAMDKA